MFLFKLFGKGHWRLKASVFGACSILLRIVMSSEMTEQLYSRGIYRAVRYLLDISIGNISWLYVYLLLLFAAILLILILDKIYQYFKPYRQWASFADSLYLLLATTLLGGGLFLWVWGYNYGRQPVEATLEMELKQPQLNDMISEARWCIAQCDSARSKISPGDNEYLDAKGMPPDLENQIRAQVQYALYELGYPASGNVRCIPMNPAGMMYWLGISGIYLGVAYIDAGSPPLTRPYTIAHEMCHGYGFADEGECNFIAWLACSQSNKPFIRYSGYLDYLVYLMAAIQDKDPSAFEVLRNEFTAGMKNDRDNIRSIIRAYGEILPQTSEKMRDLYLVTQGKKEGLENYDKMVLLVYNYRKTHRDPFIFQ